jgi:hypothetical protein
MPETLSVAVCISHGVTLSDFVTPMEILSELDPGDEASWSSAIMADIPYRVKIDYLAPTMDPVVAAKGRNPPTINPTLTCASAMVDSSTFSGSPQVLLHFCHQTLQSVNKGVGRARSRL